MSTISLYQDKIIGILFDAQRHGLFVFTRIGTGVYKSLHLMAQTAGGQLFMIQKAEAKGDQLLVTLEDERGGNRFVSVVDLREEREGALITALASISAKIQSIGPDPCPQEWWNPVDKERIEQVALGFGFFCSESKLSSIPEAWLAPAMKDYVYADFTLQNGQMLALLVRTIETKPSKQEFVLAVDQHNEVFLVKRCELHGVFSKEVVIEMSNRNGRDTTMQLPLTSLDPKHRAGFSEFLELECVRNLPRRQFDRLPAEVFEPNPSWSIA